MARGESIGGMSGYGAYQTYVYLTPSSGDEWMITAMGAGPYTYSYLQMTPDNGSNWHDMYSSELGETDVNQFITQNDTVGRRLSLFVSPTVRIRLTGGWHYYWIMGIKSKE